MCGQPQIVYLTLGNKTINVAIVENKNKQKNKNKL